MSKINPKRAYAKEILEGFPGMASQTQEKSADDIRNFRILQDGSLKKRYGSKAIHIFDDDVRGFWQGSLNQAYHSFAVAGNQVFQEVDGTMSPISTLTTSTGRVRFFPYAEHLYLIDGANLYTYNKDQKQFLPAKGYAPLYGVDWDPMRMGTVKEEVNLLSGRLRVRYLNASGSTTFRLPFYTKSIDNLRIDGVLTSAYTLSDSKREFTINTGSIPTSVEVAFTIYTNEIELPDVVKSTCVYLQEGRNGARPILFGAPRGSMLFWAMNTTEDMHNAASASYPDGDPLYFTQRTTLMLGDNDHPITSIYRSRDRLLAFHSSGAFVLQIAEDGSELAESYPLVGCMGCDAIGCSLYLEGDPVILNSGGIFSLHFSAGDPDAFTVTSLAATIEALKGDFAKHAEVCTEARYGELWFADTTDPSYRIWCFQIERKEWYCFDNNPVSFFFPDTTGVGFVSINCISHFCDGLTADGRRTIHAVYQSPYLTFAYPEAVKRTLRATLCATDTENVQLDLESEKYSIALSFKGKESGVPEFFDRRAPLGRFRFLRATLRDSSTKDTRYHRLALFANL